MKNSQAKIVKIYFSPRNLYIWTKILLNIEVNVHANFFSEVHPACHNIANSIKPGSYSKTTDRHVADSSKAVCLGLK